MFTKDITVEAAGIKFAGGDARVFSGYASKFNGVDSYGDTIVPGAYKDTLENRERPIQLRWNHYGPIIGKWTTLREDEKGLYVEGELTPGHSVAEDAYSLLKHGAVDGLSIGYRVKDSEKDGDVRMLKQIDLVEISVVESPADLGARIGDVKSLIEEFNSLKECERFLRDACGLSRSDATLLVTRVKTLAQGEPASKTDAAEIAAIKSLFQQFKVN